MQYERAGIVARFKPLHNVHAEILENMCGQAEEVIIGIGSTNEYNVRNPFSPQETREMISLTLEDYTNYTCIEVPDFYDEKKWTESTIARFGNLDIFVTANAHVAELLEAQYTIVHTTEFIDQQVILSATHVRTLMAQDKPWEHLVPPKVSQYLKEQGLVERFKQEFGLEALAYYGLAFEEVRLCS